MKKSITILLIIVALMSITLRTFAYEVFTWNYWYSDSNKVGQWTTTPTIARVNLSTCSTFSFYSAYSHGRTQWSTAGRSSTPNGSNTNSSIVCYGGNRNQIYASFGINLPNYVAGRTYSTMSFWAYLDYQGQQKKLYSMVKATVYIVDYEYESSSTLTDLFYKSVFTHELGHAFGWFGHSSNNYDVMYSQVLYVTTLTDRDINHLLHGM